MISQTTNQQYFIYTNIIITTNFKKTIDTKLLNFQIIN